MVKYYEKIQQDDLPIVTNLTQPMNPWSAYKSFDFQQYYDKKKGVRTISQANKMQSCRADQNFRLNINPISNARNFYFFNNFQTRRNVSKSYKLIHPYCELNTCGDISNDNLGIDIINRTTAFSVGPSLDVSLGVLGKVSTTPFVNLDGNPNQPLTPVRLDKIFGALPGPESDISLQCQCIDFKYGVGPSINYKFKSE
jgi:hypothetical protein